MFVHWLTWTIIVGGWFVSSVVVSLLLGPLIRNAERRDKRIPAALDYLGPTATDGAVMTGDTLIVIPPGEPDCAAPRWRSSAAD